MKAGAARQQLRQLAELNGVQTSFTDAANKQIIASPEVLAGVLKALGVPAGNPREIRESLRASLARPYEQGIEPVTVAWDQKGKTMVCYFPERLTKMRLRVKLTLEDGAVKKLNPKFRVVRVRTAAGERSMATFNLGPQPYGYHALEISAGNRIFKTLVISAPSHSYTEKEIGKTWGAFLPMYAAHSKESWGAGNFSDWERLSRWIGERGGTIAATLPLLAAFLDHPVCEPSPYSPASRLFWNEFYLDITRVPEFARCREAQTLVRSKAFQAQLGKFRREEIIDYKSQWAARRKVLELVAKYFFAKASARRPQFERFLRERPEVKEYAAFRAVCDRLKTSWHNWPPHLRGGAIEPGDYDTSTQQFHAYVQWLAHGQMDELIQRSEKHGVKLYLDLPLGVNPDGYDVWRERDSFALGASAGAPPDLFFSKGQDWGFAPLHPRRIRESGYRHVLAFLRFQMHHARLLRIDHVMGLHRLYWVPHGLEARQGTYVNYPAEELFAIFCLESHRNRTRLVGENLGTVPPAVNESMARHGLREMFVVQFQERPDPAAALPPPNAHSVASLNTHDTPTFAAHWRGDDLVESVRLGLMPHHQLKTAKKNREQIKMALVQFLKTKGFLKARKPVLRDVVPALIAWLKASPAEIALINLEDLWLETRPQNVPGTSSERPNWRHKARLNLAQIATAIKI
jgi:4-alpha-glucanotransferase